MADFSKWRILAKIWKWKKFKFFKHRHITYRWKGNFVLNNFFVYDKTWKCTQCEKMDKNYDVIIFIFFYFSSEHRHVTYRWKGNLTLNNFFAYDESWKCTQWEKNGKNDEVIIYEFLSFSPNIGMWHTVEKEISHWTTFLPTARAENALNVRKLTNKIMPSLIFPLNKVCPEKCWTQFI